MLLIPLVVTVLIESDWNLKVLDSSNEVRKIEGINRIRLEFKANVSAAPSAAIAGINRIRLEFKACFSPLNCFCTTVLIESDWNLKLIT